MGKLNAYSRFVAFTGCFRAAWRMYKQLREMDGVENGDAIVARVKFTMSIPPDGIDLKEPEVVVHGN